MLNGSRNPDPPPAASAGGPVRLVAVLGATGFVGRHVVRRLLDDGLRVTAVARRAFPLLHPALEALLLDVAAATPERLAEAIRGCGAVVNLIGIKREEGRQTFETMHVRVVETLVEAMRRAGVRRLVHISVVVSRPDPACGYHDTKWRGEQAVAATGLDWTILKPGVIYGEGDDMLSHLVKMIRAAAVFPVVGKGTSLMQPVAVADVAAAVEGALRNTATVGKAYDVVGPEPLALRTIVGRVAEALALPLRIVPTPAWLMRPAVRPMGWVMRNPLSTPAQLRMLEEGMTGNPEPARRELGTEPRPFTVEGIRRTVQACPQRLPFDLRMGRTWSGRTEGGWGRLAALLLAAAPAFAWAFGASVPDPWVRLLTASVLTGVLGAFATRGEALKSLRPDRFALASGALTGLAMVAAAWGLTRWEPAAEQARELFRWREGHTPVFLALTLPVIILGEELFWRGTVTRLLAGRCPKIAAVLIGAAVCALAHVPSGLWLLPAAALGAGVVWGTLFAATGSLAAPLISHLLFDLLVFFALQPT